MLSKDMLSIKDDCGKPSEGIEERLGLARCWQHVTRVSGSDMTSSWLVEGETFWGKAHFKAFPVYRNFSIRLLVQAWYDVLRGNLTAVK
jgi:hypothetical protein